MREKSRRSPRYIRCFALILGALAGSGFSARADDCPTDASAIATDRPDVTNSSLVVPTGSLQAENGVDWTVQHGSDVLSGTATRVRFGIAHCTELLLDVPGYFDALNGAQPSGSSNVVVSFKRQVAVPLGFDLSITGGLGFPSGSQKVSGPGYQPYLQLPWSHELGHDWALVGMFTMAWFPSDSQRSVNFEPTLSLERTLGSQADGFIEYVGEYDHQRPQQQLDSGGSWRFTRNQQLDFHVGFGLNSASVDHFFGLGYSFRLDDFLTGRGNSP